MRWKKIPGYLTIFCAIVFLLIVTYLYNELNYGSLVNHEYAEASWLMSGLPLLFILGLLMLYVGFVHAFNNTLLTFTTHSLKVRMKPMPWRKDIKFHTKNIVDFETEEHESSAGFCLKVIFSEDNRSKCLLINLSTDEARAILRDLKTFHEKAKLRRAKKELARGV